jgi:hypothetical protein
MGRLMVDPPVPLIRVQETWYETSSITLECLASELWY